MEEPALGRILGIDFGKKYVGLSVSDPLFITAQSLCTIERKRPDKFRSTLSAISDICKEYEITAFVIGLPKNLDGSENERCEFTKEFAKLLFDKINLPVFFWDERLTTVSGDRDLDFLGKKDKKKYSDELAAVLILEGFMNAQKNGVKLEAFLS